MKKILLFIIFLLLLPLSGCESAASKQQVCKGVCNLSDWNFSKDGIVRLDGSWEFYWQQLLSPYEDFSNTSPTGYYEMPGYWTSYDGLEIPPKGYATYRLLVKLDSRPQVLCISTPDIYSEYKLWVDGELIDSNWSADDVEPTYLCPNTYEIYSNETQLEIVLQIKNNLHIYAGIGQSILLGSPTQIHNSQNISFALDFFLVGACFCVGLYHLLIFLFSKRGSEILYFSLLCFSVGLWTMFFNETLIMKLFPYLPFSTGSRIVTITMPLCVMAMTLYTHALYDEDVSNIAVKLILTPNLLYAVMVLLWKPYSYLQLLVPYFISIVLVCLYGIYIAIKITIKKRPEYLYFFTGILLLVIGSFLNILEYLQVIDIFYCLPYSMVLFVIVQTLLVGNRYISATQNTALLAANLQESIDKIENAETAFLNAQIKPHFLYNTLNTIAQCCQTNPKEAEQLILYLSKYLRGTLSFENVGNAIPLKKELELVNAYYQIEKARFENINLQFNVDESLYECAVPPLILQPLVENAIKHGVRNSESIGFIKLEIKNLGASILCTVEDNGTGIEKELLPQLLSKPANMKSIGLYNIHSRLTRLYGKGLTICSSVGEGTVIQFEIPL